MFQRRHPLDWKQRLREILWPRGGWKRMLQYFRYRLVRLPGTPYAIAAGFASGIAVSFTPFVGLHLPLSIAVAWLLRASVLAAALGQVFGNPWTFPFIWIAVYNVGDWMGFGVAATTAENLDFASYFARLMDAVLRVDLDHLWSNAWPIFLPMLVGSIPTAIAVWCLFYFTLRPLVAAYHHHRLLVRRRREVSAAANPVENVQ